MSRLFFHALLLLVCGSAGFTWAIFFQSPMMETAISQTGIDPKIIGFGAAALCFMILEYPIHRMTVYAAVKKAAVPNTVTTGA